MLCCYSSEEAPGQNTRDKGPHRRHTRNHLWAPTRPLLPPAHAYLPPGASILKNKAFDTVRLAGPAPGALGGWEEGWYKNELLGQWEQWCWNAAAGVWEVGSEGQDVFMWVRKWWCVGFSK